VDPESRIDDLASFARRSSLLCVAGLAAVAILVLVVLAGLTSAGVLNGWAAGVGLAATAVSLAATVALGRRLAVSP
jgi:hypothetical protein